MARIDPSLLEQTDVSSKKRIVRSLEVALYGQEHEVEWGMADPPKISPLILAVRAARNLLLEGGP